jgi:hypothetical protein
MVHHFGARGLYNGLFLLGDRETGSYWDHITGQCVHGPLRGYQLEVFPLLHTNVSKALAGHPDAQIAISKQSLTQRLMAFFMEWGRKSKRGVLPPGFKKTMGKEDMRRPRMDMGLCVWSNNVHRYYPLERIRKRGGAVVDELDRRRLLVYIDPVDSTPAALYTEAVECKWQGSELHLDSGEILREGGVFEARGGARAITRPMQLFTRWYGCAYTFPGCEVFGD